MTGNYRILHSQLFGFPGFVHTQTETFRRVIVVEQANPQESVQHQYPLFWEFNANNIFKQKLLQI
jgi:hypothetical protein